MNNQQLNRSTSSSSSTTPNNNSIDSNSNISNISNTNGNITNNHVNGGGQLNRSESSNGVAMITSLSQLELNSSSNNLLSFENSSEAGTSNASTPSSTSSSQTPSRYNYGHNSSSYNNLNFAQQNGKGAPHSSTTTANPKGSFLLDHIANIDSNPDSDGYDVEFKFDLDYTTIDHLFDGVDNLDELLNQYSKQEQVISNCFNKGIDLKVHASEVEHALEKYDKEMNDLYQNIIPDYVNERESFALMYKTLRESNQLLTGFEDMLSKFQTELTNITNEMRELQDKSITKSLKCTNRKSVVEKLNKVIDELTLSDDIIHLLTDGEVNDQYLQYLSIFSKKIGYIQSQKQNNVAAINNVEDNLIKLINIVLDKIYKFFNNQFISINSLPILQQKQQEFTLYRQAFFFLYKHTRKVARHLYEQYKDTVEKIYSLYYRNYISFLERLQLDPTTKNDLIGVPDSKTKGFFSSKSNKLKLKTSIFTIENRIQVLSELDEPSLKPQSITSLNSTSSNQIKYNYETIYRSMLFVFLDLVSYETMFIKDYFLSNIDATVYIFGKAEAYLMENLNSFVTSTYDSVALLLVLCITNKYKKKINFKSECTDRIFTSSTHMINARLHIIFQENLDSMVKANVKDLGPFEENRPHYVIRRYAELIGSISSIYDHLPSESQPLVREQLDMMRAVMSKLIQKMSEEIKDNARLNRPIFLLNNYDLILTILNEKDVSQTIQDKEYYQILYEQESENFSMEQLMSFPYFKRLITTVKDVNPSLINMYTVEEINHPSLTKEIQESILKDFALNWRSGIEEMNVIVTQLFPNFKNGMRIFQMILDRLFNYYKQFTQIILKYFKQLKTSQYFIAETEISYEIKKYYVAFD